MTKRTKSSDLVKARKETKRLQREAKTRLRKARKHAQESGDDIELEKLSKLEKRFFNSLKSSGKSGLPKSYTHNVMWEKGRALALKELNRKNVLSKKGKRRQSRRTFERLFGKSKTKTILHKIGGREMSRLSNEFWQQMYMAQDMLFALGIVPADEIMGRWGSIGSGLLETGKEVVNDGYWTGLNLKFENGFSGDGSSSTASLKLVVSDDETKVETSELAVAIVEWYKEKYGLD